MKVGFIFGLILIIGVISFSGCIDSDEYNVTEGNGTYLATLTESEVQEDLGPSPYDAPYYTVTDYGMKVIEGQTVYYTDYTDNETIQPMELFISRKVVCGMKLIGLTNLVTLIRKNRV